MLVGLLAVGLGLALLTSGMNSGRGPPSWAMTRLCDAIEAKGVGLEALPPLLALLRGEPLGGWFRSRAVVVRRFGADLVPPLREALGSPATEPTARRWIFWVLQDLGPSAAAALPEVLQALDGPDEFMRGEAIGALDCISVGRVPLPTRATSRLIELMNGGDGSLDLHALRILERHWALEPDVRRALVTRWEQDVSRPVNRDGALAGLRRALAAPEPDLRLRAARTLRKTSPYDSDPRIDAVLAEVPSSSSADPR
ncbi:MAG: hypothetical protein KF878_23055 [Planctomycetes bacterium]|nr:hypothetical protein [Planctomycetota bacterium]